MAATAASVPRGLLAGATPTVPPQDLPLATVLDESFANPSLAWPVDAASTAWLADGALHLSPRTAGEFVALGLPGGDLFRDVVVTAAFHKAAGPPGGGFGIILRDSGPGPRDGLSQSGRYLVVEVGDEGTYGIWERQQDHWDEVVPWTPAAVVKPGTNELTVRAIGPHVLVLINGSTITSVDVDLAQGSLGLFAGGDGNEIAVEHLVVAAPRPSLNSAVAAITADDATPAATATVTAQGNWFARARELIRQYDRKHGTVLDSALQRTHVILAHHPGMLAAFVPSLATITLDPDLQLETPQAAATVLAHEAEHASDTYLYGGEATSASCYSYEISAFHLQAVMWEDFYGPGGKPTADTDLEQELNDIVRLINTDAGSLIRDIQSAYQDVCSFRPN